MRFAKIGPRRSTGNVRGHKVGGKLNTGEGKAEDSSERTDETGLTDTGYTLEKHVTAGDDRDDNVFDDILLTYHVELELVFDLFNNLIEFFNLFDVIHLFLSSSICK